MKQASPQVQPKLSTAPAHPERYKWWVVFMLWSICFFNYADRQAIFSVFPKLEQEFGFTPVQLSWIGSAFMVVYALGAPVAGYAGDRWPRKQFILGGCVVWSFVTMLTGQCGRLWQFIAVRALEGSGETFYIPASTSLMSDYHGVRTRSRALAIHNSSVYLGTIAGGWLGAWFAVHSGWRSGFYFFGGAGMLLALALSRFLREPRRGQAELNAEKTANAGADTPPDWRVIGRALLRNRTALLLLGAFLAANFVAAIFLTWTPTFLVKKFHFQLTAAGLSGTIFIHLSSAVSVPMGGWLADCWARRRAGGRMLVQAAGLLAGAVFVFLVGTTRNVSVLLIVMSLFGLCKGLYDSNIFAAIFDVVEPRARGTAAGIMNTVGWGGGALGPLAVGWLSEHGRHATQMENMSEAIAFCSVIYLVGAGLLLQAARCAHRDAVS
ncbi:MAG TPA: MFS transporter [Verrucomicrobiae bacterium]|nr:MFS transporter [Verrucomicrobiae bacterium]